MIWRNIKELTLVKSLSAAQGVTRHSHSMVIWKNIEELMLVENHSAAQPVTRIVHSLMIWRNIKELTPEKSHSAAQGVTRNSHSMVVWKNIKNSHWWRVIQLLKVWQEIHTPWSFGRTSTNTVDQQQSPQQQQPSQQQSPPSSPPFHGWTPSECKPDMNKQRYETDEEEFEDLNECFYEPPSRLVTPRKRPAEDDDGSGESRNCCPRYNWTQF